MITPLAGFSANTLDDKKTGGAAQHAGNSNSDFHKPPDIALRFRNDALPESSLIRCRPHRAIHARSWRTVFASRCRQSSATVCAALARGRLVPQGQPIFSKGRQGSLLCVDPNRRCKAFQGNARPARANRHVYVSAAIFGIHFWRLHRYSAAATTDVALCIYPRSPFTLCSGKPWI